MNLIQLKGCAVAMALRHSQEIILSKIIMLFFFFVDRQHSTTKSSSLTETGLSLGQLMHVGVKTLTTTGP